MIEVGRDGDYNRAVRSFADLINRETNGGWEFHSMESIMVYQKPGCLAALFGQKTSYVPFNMLVFSNANATTPEAGGMPVITSYASYTPIGSKLITSGQTLSGVISHKNGTEQFHVDVTQPGSLSIKVTTDDEDGLPHWDTYVNVLDPTGKKISTSGRFGFPYDVEVDLPYIGTYIIEITSPKTGRFYLTVQH